MIIRDHDWQCRKTLRKRWDSYRIGEHYSRGWHQLSSLSNYHPEGCCASGSQTNVLRWRRLYGGKTWNAGSWFVVYSLLPSLLSCLLCVVSLSRSVPEKQTPSTLSLMGPHPLPRLLPHLQVLENLFSLYHINTDSSKSGMQFVTLSKIPPFVYLPSSALVPTEDAHALKLVCVLVVLVLVCGQSLSWTWALCVHVNYFSRSRDSRHRSLPLLDNGQCRLCTGLVQVLFFLLYFPNEHWKGCLSCTFRLTLTGKTIWTQCIATHHIECFHWFH